MVINSDIAKRQGDINNYHSISLTIPKNSLQI